MSLGDCVKTPDAEKDFQRYLEHQEWKKVMLEFFNSI